MVGYIICLGKFSSSQQDRATFIWGCATRATAQNPRDSDQRSLDRFIFLLDRLYVYQKAFIMFFFQFNSFFIVFIHICFYELSKTSKRVPLFIPRICQGQGQPKTRPLAFQFNDRKSFPKILTKKYVLLNLYIQKIIGADRARRPSLGTISTNKPNQTGSGFCVMPGELNWRDASVYCFKKSARRWGFCCV